MSSDPAPTRDPSAGAAPDPVEDFLDHIEQGRAETAIELALDRVHRGQRVTDVIQDLLGPAQQLVGHRWHTRRYTVVQEHVASAVVDDVLGLLTAHTPQPTGEHTVALVCAEGEWHTTPARMAALCLRDAGWRVHFLGGSMPAEHLATSLPQLTADAVLVSCTLPLALAGVPALIEASTRHGLPVLTGGIGFGPDDLRSSNLGAHGHAMSVTGAVDLLTAWVDRPPDPPTPLHDPEAARERAELAARHGELVEAAHAHLRSRQPAVMRDTEHARDHTQRDLGYILEYVGIALLVDDARVVTELTGWLGDLLDARGVPQDALDQGLATLQDHLPDDMPRTRELLEHGRSPRSR